MDEYPVLDSAWSIEFIVQCCCRGTYQNDFPSYEIRVIIPVVGIHKGDFLKFRSLREVIYENILRVPRRVGDLPVPSRSLKRIYDSLSLPGNDIFCDPRIEVFLKNLKRKYLISLFLGHYAVNGGVVGIDFRMKVPDPEGVILKCRNREKLFRQGKTEHDIPRILE